MPDGSAIKTTKFILDGREVEAYGDESIWQVAQRLGTEIPHLCYTPEPGYRADGNCRVLHSQAKRRHGGGQQFGPGGKCPRHGV